MAYIDKDLLLKDIGESVVFSVKNGGVSPELRGARKIIDRIQRAPTADVEEVRHGQWLPQIVSGVKAWDCSECKTLGSPHWKRCPICEAKMDGGKAK